MRTDTIGKLDGIIEVMKHLPGQHDQATYDPTKGASTGVGGYVRGRKLELSDEDLVQMECDSVVAIGRDKVLEVIMTRQGFGGLPKLVDKEEMDEAIASGAQEVFRGVKSDEAVRDTLYGPIYAGSGIRGNGIYVAYGDGDRELAEQHAGQRGAQGVMRMALRKDANIISLAGAKRGLTREQNQAMRLRDSRLDTLHKQQQQDGSISKEDYDNTRRQIIVRYDNEVATIFYDTGRWAALKGYDAIDIPSVQYKIILNRTALMIEKSSG
jgi:stress response protein YsnF